MVRAGTLAMDVCYRLSGLTENESVCGSRTAPCDTPAGGLWWWRKWTFTKLLFIKEVDALHCYTSYLCKGLPMRSCCAVDAWSCNNYLFLLNVHVELSFWHRIVCVYSVHLWNLASKPAWSLNSNIHEKLFTEYEAKSQITCLARTWNFGPWSGVQSFDLISLTILCFRYDCTLHLGFWKLYTMHLQFIGLLRPFLLLKIIL